VKSSSDQVGGVAICDTESRGLHHEEVNAAVIAKFVAQHGKQALLFCESAHWQCLQRIFSQRLGAALPVQHSAINPPIGNKNELQDYATLVSDVFATMATKNIRHVLFTNTHYACLQAIMDKMQAYPDISITMIVHGQLDEHWFFSRWQRWRLPTMPLDKLMAASNQRIRFVSVSGHIQGMLETFGKKNLQSASLHHPYLWNKQLAGAMENKQKPKLCCIGSINKDKSRRQMRKLVAKLSQLDQDFELTFFGNFRYRQSDDRIVIHNRRFEKSEFDELIPQYDFILQPYLPGSYQLKASGILFDAINYQVPLITTHTAFTQYYFDLLGEIGVLAGSHDALLHTLTQFIANPQQVPVDAMKHQLNLAQDVLDSMNSAIDL